MTNSDYPFIRAWGRMMGSHDSYIEHQVELASDERAPANATYRRGDGSWATTDEIGRAETRRQLGLDPLPFQEPELGAIVPALRLAVLWIESFRDRFGMTGVDQLDERTLLIRFACGGSIRLSLDVRPLGSPE